MKTVKTILQGQRVLVKLSDGTKFVENFVDRTSGTVVFSNRRVAREDIKSMSIYRRPPFTWLELNGYDVDLDFASEFPDQCPLRERASFNVQETTNLCTQPLNANGECPEHGKVRLRPREKLEEESKDVSATPRLRRYVRPTNVHGKILNRRRRNFLSKVSV
jgi:hypothetical protein